MSGEKHRFEYPPAIRKMFGSPPIIVGEDPSLYAELLALIVAEVEPTVLTEWLLAKDIADAEWELMRLNGFKVDMINRRARPALSSHIERVAAIAAAGPKPRKGTTKKADDELDKLVEEHMEHVREHTTKAFEQTITEQLNADRMVTAAVGRRRAAYAEVERLRSKKVKHLPRSPSVQPGIDPSGEDAAAAPVRAATNDRKGAEAERPDQNIPV